MKRILLACSLAFLSIAGMRSQHIALTLPAHKGKLLTVALKYGTQSDTVYNAALDNNGQATVTLPDKYKGYRGMATLKTGDYAVFDFIVAGEDFSLSCTEEYPHGGNVTFSGSPENESLQSWFMSQQKRREKLGLLGELLRSYDAADGFRPLLEKEQEQLQSQQSLFENELRRSPLYASQFIRYYNYLNGEVSGLLFADTLQMEQARAYVRDSLDINGLFTSGLWFGTLNDLLALYDNDTPYHKDFITDMSLLLKRAATDRVYSTLADNLFAICENTGWNDLEEQLAYFLINDGRIRNPEGRLKRLMTLFKLGKGSRVPELSFGSLPEGKVLLVFYESGCNACENEIQLLKGNYPLLKEKGYEVVSVAADRDEQVFNNTSEGFPWKARYCDFEGFSGVDFKNFGVIGTPTFYVIDGQGVLQGRYARLYDTGILK
jgi:predicted DCC family thiol-disulfide oxidoreductase YuxK